MSAGRPRTPGADIRDMVEASGEMTKAIKNIDPGHLVLATGQMAAAIISLGLPGSVEAATRIIEDMLREAKTYIADKPGKNIIGTAVEQTATQTENAKRLADAGLSFISKSGVGLLKMNPRPLRFVLENMEKLPSRITDVLNQGLLKGGNISYANEKLVNIDFQGGMNAADKKFDEIIKGLGVDPKIVKPLEEGKTGRKAIVDDNTTVSVRAVSSGLIPTVEILIKTPKLRIKMRFPEKAGVKND